MSLPKRPRDPVERSKLIFDMAIGEVPNDKEQVLEAQREQEQAPRLGPPARRRSAAPR